MDIYKQNRYISENITCYKSDPNINKHEGKPKKVEEVRLGIVFQHNHNT